MTMPMYRTKTIRISDHRMRLRMPSTFSCVGATLKRAHEALPERVQRARSDVAENDAERRERESRLERPGRHAPWLAPGEKKFPARRALRAAKGR